jgi:hypothetical protein
MIILNKDSFKKRLLSYNILETIFMLIQKYSQNKIKKQEMVHFVMSKNG